MAAACALAIFSGNLFYYICGLGASADASKPLFSRKKPQLRSSSSLKMLLSLRPLDGESKNRKSPQAFPVF